MKKDYQLAFYKADYVQYNEILSNEEIKSCIAGFLLKYVSLEAFFKKMLIAMKEASGRKLTTKEKRNLGIKVSDIKRVLEYFEIECDEDLIERVFGSNDQNYMQCSVKKLRDRLVHSVNDNVLRVILERYESIIRDLDALSLLLK